MDRIDQSKVYLAAPFFNDTQRALCQQIEDTFASCERSLCSPRRDVGIVTPENARAVFDANLAAIDGCTLVLAVLDFPLDNQQQMRACEPINRPTVPCALCATNPDARRGCRLCDGAGVTFSDVRLTPKENWRAASGPIHVPDTGTAIEIGYAVGRGIPVVAFTSAPPGRMNVMLLCAARGVVFNGEQLHKFLQPVAHPLTHFVHRLRGHVHFGRDLLDRRAGQQLFKRVNARFLHRGSQRL